MDMAKAISQLSKDIQTKVGAVLVNPRGRQIASGYNGFCRGANDDELPKTRPDKYQYMIHAETNLLYNCLDEGICTRNGIIICTLSPCDKCLRACYQSGIKTIIYDRLYQKNSNFYKEIKDINVHVNKDIVTGYTHLTLNSVKSI